MGVIVDELEQTCSIPPARLFKGFILDSDNLLPKIVPVFKSFETVQGDGGVGTVKLITFYEGDQVKYVKHRTDEIDEKNHVFKYTVVEGGDLDENIESINNTIKIEPGPNGGSVYKSRNEYHIKGESHHGVQEKIKQVKEGAKAFLQAVEAHLHANPHEYK